MIYRSSRQSGKFSVIFQSLYLANLLLLPGLFFLVLLYFMRQYSHIAQLNKEQKIATVDYQSLKLKYLGIGKIHLIRCIQLSILVSFLLVVIPLLVLYFSTQLQTSIMVGLVYFVTLHAGFVLIGMFNLSRAMANKLPIF